MLIKNTCARLIAIDEVRIAPGAVAEVADSFEQHPVIKNYIDAKMISIASAEAEEAEEEKKEAEEAEKEEPSLDKLTKDQLVALAEEKGIDLTGASTKAEIIALINAQ